MANELLEAERITFKVDAKANLRSTASMEDFVRRGRTQRT